MSDGHKDPNAATGLPIELIFKIADDLYTSPGDAIQIQDSLTQLFTTSRAMHHYSRTLIFHRIFIHSLPTGTPPCEIENLQLTKPTKVMSIQTFNKLIRQDASLLSLFRDVTLNAVPDGYAFPAGFLQAWLEVLDQLEQSRDISLGLRKFTFTNGGTRELAFAMIKSLLRWSNLVSVTLTTNWRLMVTVFHVLPSDLKELTYIGTMDRWDDEQYDDEEGEEGNEDGATDFKVNLASEMYSLRRGWRDSERSEGPNLDSLTLIDSKDAVIHWNAIMFDFDNLPEKHEPFPLTNLKHLQLVKDDHIQMFRTFISPSLGSLQCLHMPAQYLFPNNDLNLYLDLASLPALQCLELSASFIRDTLTYGLGLAMDGLSLVIQEHSTIVQGRRLKFSILIQETTSQSRFYGKWAWQSICGRSTCRELELFPVFGYMALEEEEEGKVRRVVSLGRYQYTEEEVASLSWNVGADEEYCSLWRGGPCAGWQSHYPVLL
ncbi:hypothetical protein BKA70DRAFT_1335528 [Coprinopsis sp. MPI-PUGE-AT-0042]|nr:hypothetical protein BKA70DRAFT_1335528 [Coprinopsis sp. MPI-PUGE-AT-0042]